MKEDLISSEFKTLIPSFLLTLALVVSIYLIYQFGIPALINQKAELDKVNTDHASLVEKQQILTSLDPSLLSGADTSVIAVPTQDSSVLVMSQLKNLASQSTLVIRDISVGSSFSSGGDVNPIAISMTVEGDQANIISYINSLKTLAPMIFLNSLKVEDANGSTQGVLALTTYWADLPKQITSINEPIKALSDSELTTLARLGSLTLPVQTQLTPTTGSTGRSDPFN